MNQYDVYISYAKEDVDSIQKLVKEIELHGVKTCLDVRDFDKTITSHENRNQLVENCSSCLLVFSTAYCKRASEWSYFTKFLKKVNNNNDKNTVTDVLETKVVICVYLSECNIPSLFSKQKMLKWVEEEEYNDVFWQRLIKYLKSAKKKVDVKKALISKFQNVIADRNEKSADIENLNNIVTINNQDLNDKNILGEEDNTGNNSTQNYFPKLLEDKINSKIAEKTKKMYYKVEEPGKCLKVLQEHAAEVENYTEIQSNKEQKEIINDHLDNLEVNSDDEKKVEDELNTTPNYEMFESVYPHLVSSSFSAEDEDLTKEEVDNLTLKMEEVETIMFLNEKSTFDNQQRSNKFSEDCNIINKQKCEFGSQYEQMQLLDILQSLTERLQITMDRLVPGHGHASRKKRYRRLLQRYQDCIIKVVNGKKDSALIQNLPLVLEYLDEKEDQCKCYCCGNLYHSKRALELHVSFCVKQTWIELIKRKNHIQGTF